MIAAILFALLFSTHTQAQEGPSAYEIYSRLLEESVDSSVRYSETIGEWNLIYFGYSHGILNLVSPSSATLDELVQSLSPEKRALFLQELFSKQFFSKQGSGKIPGNYQLRWKVFLEREKKKGDIPLASLPDAVAQDIFYGSFPGLEGTGISSTYDGEWHFMPQHKLKAKQFGISLCNISSEEKLYWGLKFENQKSYGDREKLMAWLRRTLDISDNMIDHELHFVISHNDFSLRQQKISSRLRQVITTYKNPYSLLSNRLYDQAEVARVLSQDLSGMGQILSWDWDAPASVPQVEELADRFGVSKEIAEKAFYNLTDAANYDRLMLAPLIAWRDIPYLAEAKVKALEFLSKRFIEEIAKIEGDKESRKLALLHLQHNWVNAAALANDMEFALRPRPRERIGKILSYRPSSSQKDAVDVNKIALGVEYTGRFPIETYAYIQDTTENSDTKERYLFPWNEQRQELMQEIARELSLGLRGTGEIQKKAGGHGHGLGTSYAFLDGRGRSWSVDWDGILRGYDDAGEVVEESVRGGHLEVSTAKFVPKVWEIETVYKVFKKFNITPDPLQAGGGHINVDLAPFEGNPKAVARFLTLYHQYRKIIELMFSNGDYLHFAISDHLLKELKDFRGSEAELKEMLYNERYFNSLLEGKTRHFPINMIPYFQEVIPKEFLAEDIDQFNSKISWKPRFRFVRPEEKRMELRFFHKAPRDAFESALHIRFVRAMLHAALNRDFPLKGRIKALDDELFSYLKGPKRAYKELDSLCQTLQLECDLYRPLVAEGLSEVDIAYQEFSLAAESSFLRKKRIANRKMVAFGQTLKNDHIWGQAVSCKDRAKQLLNSSR